MSDSNHLNHKFESNYEMMDHLHAAQNIENIGKEHHDSIYKYTGDSSSLNKSLIDGLYPADLDTSLSSPHNVDLHNTILEKATHTPDPFHVYTGSSVNFDEMAKSSKNKIVHLPSHISTSLSEAVARKFGSTVSRINISPKDKTLAIGKISKLAREHEVIIPAGTRLKYTHTDDNGIHHFDIHSQVKVPTHKDLGKSIDDTISNISKNPSILRTSYLHRFAGDRLLQPHFNEDRVHALIKTVSKNSANTPRDILTISNNPVLSDKINSRHLVSSALDTKNPIEAAFAIRHKTKDISDKDLEDLHDYAANNKLAYTHISPDTITHPIDARRYTSHILNSDYNDVDKYLVGNVFRHALKKDPARAHALASSDIVQRSVAYISPSHPLHSSIIESNNNDVRNHLYHSVITNPNIHVSERNNFAEIHSLHDTDPKTNLGAALIKHTPENMAKNSPHINDIVPALLEHGDKDAVLSYAFRNPHLDTKKLIQNHGHDFSSSVIDTIPSSLLHSAINDETLSPSTRVKLMCGHRVHGSELSPNSIDTYLNHFDKRWSDHATATIAGHLENLTDSQKTKFIEKTRNDKHIQYNIIRDSSRLKAEHLDQLVKNNPENLEHIFNRLEYSIPDDFFERHLDSKHAQGSPALSAEHLDKIVHAGNISNNKIFDHPAFNSQHADHIIANGTPESKHALSLSDKELNSQQISALRKTEGTLKSLLQSGRDYDSDTIRDLYNASKKDHDLHRYARNILSRQPNAPADVLKDILKKPNWVNSHDYACTHRNLDQEGINCAIENGRHDISRRYGLSHGQISQIIDKFPEEGTGENKRVIHNLNYYNEHAITPEHIDQILDKHPSSPDLVLEHRNKLNDSHLEKIITNPHAGLKVYNAIRNPRASHDLVNRLVMGQIGVYGSREPYDIQEARHAAVSNRNFNGVHLSNLLADHVNTDAKLIKHALNENPSILDKSHIEAAKARPDSKEILDHMRLVRENLFDINMEKTR